MPTKTSETKEEKSKPKGPRRANGEGSIHKIKEGKHKGKWVAQVTIGKRPDGKPDRKTFYGKGRAEVKEKLKAIMDELAQGVNLQKQGVLTFGSWIQTWMDDYKKVSLRLSTWETYDRLIRIHIKPALETYTLRDLDTGHIQRLYNKMIENGSSSATVRKVHQIIDSCLAKAKENRLIAWNPADSVELPKLESKKVRAMTTDEMTKFLSVLKLDVWGVGLLTLLGTGLRIGELLALEWPDIDLRKKIIHVKRAMMRTKAKGLVLGEPKTPRSVRDIPIPPYLAAAIRLYRIKQVKGRLASGEKYQDNNLVFCTSKGTKIIPRNFQRKYYKLRDDTGLPNDLNLHSLRHTYSTRLLEQGENMKTIGELLGHVHVDTTGRYTDVLPETKRKAADQINQLLKKKASQK